MPKTVKPGRMAATNDYVRRSLHAHLRLYAAATILFILGNVVAAGEVWFVWPIFVWGFLVILHVMYVKSMAIDGGWAQRRAKKVTESAYDASHIADIRDRYRDRTP